MSIYLIVQLVSVVTIFGVVIYSWLMDSIVEEYNKLHEGEK